MWAVTCNERIIPTCFMFSFAYIPFLDRYVIFGNHIDAWVFGGVDLSSGTSVMMEIARVLGEKVKNGKYCYIRQ